MQQSPPEPDENTSIKPADFEFKPWKYVGYRGFCDFIASDNDFLVLRRFSTMTVRVLLMLQDELRELEDQLQRLESSLARERAPDLHNGSFRQETKETRLKLVKEIDRKLRAYNELVIQHSDIRARPRVPPKDVVSIMNWHENHQTAILKEETEYINLQRDIFKLVPRTTTPLRRLLEKSSHFRLSRYWRKRSLDEDTVIYNSEQRLDFFVSAIIIFFGLVMLIVPLWALASVDGTYRKLGVITAFIMAFLPLVTFSSEAKPFETLAATAAYAAVLAVFLQIGS